MKKRMISKIIIASTLFNCMCPMNITFAERDATYSDSITVTTGSAITTTGPAITTEVTPAATGEAEFLPVENSVPSPQPLMSREDALCADYSEYRDDDYVPVEAWGGYKILEDEIRGKLGKELDTIRFKDLRNFGSGKPAKGINIVGNGNEMPILPSIFGEFHSLKSLHLRKLGITKIPPEIGNMTNLSSLLIYDNELVELPRELGQLTNMSTLSLAHNQLTALPPEIGEFRLYELDLSSNALIDDVVDLFEFVRPIDIQVEDNLIKDEEEQSQLIYTGKKAITVPVGGQVNTGVQNTLAIERTNNETNDLPEVYVDHVILEAVDSTIINEQGEALKPGTTEALYRIVRDNSNEKDRLNLHLVTETFTIRVIDPLHEDYSQYNDDDYVPIEAWGGYKVLEDEISNGLNKSLDQITFGDIRNYSGIIDINKHDDDNCKMPIVPSILVEFHNLRELRLDYLKIEQLPSKMDGLKKLETLSLYGNKLKELPASIGSLSNLTSLLISTNQLTSLPPSIGKLANLNSLYLYENQLTALPAEIGELANLTHLYLDDNQLTTFPSVIFELKTLKELSLSGNQLTTLPPEIGELTKMVDLFLSNNQLTALPPEIGNLADLEYLDISSNALIDDVGDDIADYVKLTDNLIKDRNDQSQLIYTGENDITISVGEFINEDIQNLLFIKRSNGDTDPLPQAYENHIILYTKGGAIIDKQGKALKLGTTEAQYRIERPNASNDHLNPHLATESIKIRVLDPSIDPLHADYSDYNNTDYVPVEAWGGYKVLEDEITDKLGISLDQITFGDIREYNGIIDINKHDDDNCKMPIVPSILVEFHNLTKLTLDYLKIEQLPPRMEGLYELRTLSLRGNNLKELPATIGSLFKLTTLQLDNNQLNSLPTSIGELSNLTHLYLYKNQLTSLPPEIGSLSNLTTLQLYNNQLTSLPPDIGSLSKLTHLQLDDNQLASLPPDIGKLANLKALYLGNNQLTTFPSVIFELKTLKELSLYSNQLTSLPSEIGELTKMVDLFLNDNQLTALPPEIGNLSDLEYLDISSNTLINDVGDEIADYVKLTDNLIKDRNDQSQLHYSGGKNILLSIGDSITEDIDNDLGIKRTDGTTVNLPGAYASHIILDVKDNTIINEEGEALNPGTTEVRYKILRPDFSEKDRQNPHLATEYFTIEVSNQLTVTFLDPEGKKVNEQTVEYGSDATPPILPTKEGYTVVWDNDLKNITSHLTVKAKYDINSYTVIFTDHDGTTLDTQSIKYGSTATKPADPNKVGYTFKGWDVSFDSITSDLTVKALYDINSYKVTFVDHDGTPIDTQGVDYGSPATKPADPTRVGHTFTGWNKEFNNITSDLTVKAQYDINSYKVTFIDHDGTPIDTQGVDYGSPATKPADPTRVGHTFKGWDVAFDNITSDLTVKALYDINSYKVTFVDHDGTPINTQSVDYGSPATKPANPTKIGHTFKWWDVAFDKITSDLTVTAQYDINSYTVTFVDHDGTPLDTQTINSGSAATKPADPTRVGHTFTGWDVTFDNITSELTVTAQYDINNYKVTFVDHEGKELKNETVEFGSAVTAPTAPTRIGHTFKGWDKPLVNVSNNMTVKALYNINSYTVTFVDYDGKTLKTQDVNYGSDATAPSEPSRSGYRFKSWDKRFDNIMSDLTVKAQYRRKSSGGSNSSSISNTPLTDNTVSDDSTERRYKPFVSGYPDGTFGFDNTLTREEMITMIIRMLDLPIVSGNPFTDVDGDMWSDPFISTAYQNGLVAGRGDGTYDPKGLVTSDELYFMLKNIEKSVDEGGLQSVDGYEVIFNQDYLQLKDKLPDLLTRGYATEVLIRFSNRTVDQEYLKTAMKNNEINSFSDISDDHLIIYSALIDHWVDGDEEVKWIKHELENDGEVDSVQVI